MAHPENAKHTQFILEHCKHRQKWCCSQPEFRDVLPYCQRPEDRTDRHHLRGGACPPLAEIRKLVVSSSPKLHDLPAHCSGMIMDVKRDLQVDALRGHLKR